MKIFALAALLAITTLADAGPRKDMLLAYKQALTDRCVERASPQLDSSAAGSRCGCITEVTARRMSLREIIELEGALDGGIDTRNLPQVRRVEADLLACRAQ